jgi:molybdopterin-guanine dinucleotide biosynthesis protein A
MAAAFIIAGGKSTRMGTDKALLKLDGRTLLERALASGRAVHPNPVIIGPAEKFSAYAPVIEDIFPGQGPLAAIHAGLRSSTEDLNLMLAVDMLFVTPALLNYLCARAAASDATVTVPRVNGRWQPLCAVYRREFMAPAERALRAGRNKIDALFGEVPTLAPEEDELLAQGFTAGQFRNVNTLADLEAARKQTMAR